ncbi:hypothetical protein ERUR111494_04060 [Erysipelothrix urinaevulpis]|uniref:PTS sugar transporter subunit IIA domain-containing protein n=1 Tax=Erysipelothrix urinaevulpis TaxID=2683717 RepID=UPI001357F499|nr:hypothetical protein [Erysipelothrix urinaevulpis]
MFQVLVLSHGNLSVGMKETLDLFEINYDCCRFVNAYVSEEDPRSLIKDFLTLTPKKVILTDLKSGSLTRLAIEEGVLDRDDVYLISGFNLAMLIGILTQQSLNDTVIEEVIAFSQMDIERLENQEVEEESFF